MAPLKRGMILALEKPMNMVKMTVLLVLLALAAPSMAAPLCVSVFSTSSKQAINVRLAQQAGLHYASGPTAGYTRQGDRQSGFVYIDSKGNAVTDPTVLARIEALKIPPAWQQVWIAEDPLSHVQAQGNDQKGRRQSRYHDVWNTEVKDIAKFERMERFGQAIPRLHQQIRADINLPVSDVRSRLAAVSRLLETAGIRVGGERYAAENEHYGLTTLQVRHVLLNGPGQLIFDFIGKEGVAHAITVDDPDVNRVIRAATAGKGPDDSLFDVNAAQVNKYIKNSTADEFSAKDIRTWVGTVIAARTFIAHGPAQNPQDLAKTESLAAESASFLLGNNPDTARDNYIDPTVFRAFENGRLWQVLPQAHADSDHPLDEALVLALVHDR